MSLSPWRATRLWLFSGRFTLWPGCRCPYRRFLLRPGAIRFVTPNKTRSTRDSVTGKWKRASGHFVVRLEFSEASLRVQQGLHQGALGQWIGRAVKAAREKGGAAFNLSGGSGAQTEKGGRGFGNFFLGTWRRERNGQEGWQGKRQG